MTHMHRLLPKDRDPLAVAIRRLVRRSRRAVSRAVHPRTAHQRNELIVYAESPFQAIVTSGALSFVSVFLVRLGSPNWLVGLLSSLPALVLVLAIIPVGAYVQRHGHYVATTNWSRVVFRGVISAFALLPLLPIGIAPYVLVAARSLVSIPGAAINVALTTVWGQATTPDRRPRMLSVRMAIQGLVAAGFGFAAGQWLDFAPYPLNYQLLFLSAIVATVCSIVIMSRLKLPEHAAPPTEASAPRAGLKEMLALVRDTPAFRNYSLASFVYRMGMWLPMALFAIYRVRTLGASDSWIGTLLTVQRLTSVFAYFALSRLLARSRFRRHLWIACAAMGQYPITQALASTAQMLVIPEFLAGIIAPGNNIFMTDTLYRVSPEDNRPAFISANTFLANITAFVAPLLGTALADALGIRTALWIAGGLRIAGGVLFWRLGVNSAREETA